MEEEKKQKDQSKILEIMWKTQVGKKPRNRTQIHYLS